MAAIFLPAIASAQTSPALRYGPPAPLVSAPYLTSSIADNAPEAFPTESSSLSMVMVETETRSAGYFGGGYQAEGATQTRTIRPFSDLAAEVKFGSAGVGFDLATPLSQHLNLRGGASFFSYNANLVEDGLHIDGDISFSNAALSLDYYPFHTGFRISPGITLYNDTSLNANLTVPGNQNYSLGDQDAISDPLDPIRGTATFHFGHKVAPRLTMGWGNMIPRKGNQHWSVPFEVGVQFASTPKVRLNITGSGCQYDTDPTDGSVSFDCGPVDQSDVQQEQRDLQSDINGLRFFPVISLGVSYRFGLGGRR